MSMIDGCIIAQRIHVLDLQKRNTMTVTIQPHSYRVQADWRGAGGKYPDQCRPRISTTLPLVHKAVTVTLYVRLNITERHILSYPNNLL